MKLPSSGSHLEPVWGPTDHETLAQRGSPDCLRRGGRGIGRKKGLVTVVIPSSTECIHEPRYTILDIIRRLKTDFGNVCISAVRRS